VATAASPVITSTATATVIKISPKQPSLYLRRAKEFVPEEREDLEEEVFSYMKEHHKSKREKVAALQREKNNVKRGSFSGSLNVVFFGVDTILSF